MCRSNFYETGSYSCQLEIKNAFKSFLFFRLIIVYHTLRHRTSVLFSFSAIHLPPVEEGEFLLTFVKRALFLPLLQSASAEWKDMSSLLSVHRIWQFSQFQHAAQMLNVSDCLYYSYLSPICTGRQSVASTVYITMVINDNIYVQK